MHNFAYIDAGTGSMFIQVLFGMILAGSVVLRSFIRKAFTKLKLSVRQKPANEEA